VLEGLVKSSSDGRQVYKSIAPLTAGVRDRTCNNASCTLLSRNDNKNYNISQSLFQIEVLNFLQYSVLLTPRSPKTFSYLLYSDNPQDLS
jgi:hypothetical protein